MRIGIDCRTILNPEFGERAGVAHYTHLLVKHLLQVDHENEYVLFFDYRMKSPGEYEQRNVKIRYFPFSQYGRFLPFAYSHMLTAASLVRERLDLFHSPTTSIPFGYNRPAVVTVHDLAIFKNPAWFPLQLFSTKLLVPQSIKRARHLLAVSQSTKKDMLELFDVPADKVTVVHEGCFVDTLPLRDRTVDVRKKFHLPKTYALFLGTIEPRKNIPRLIAAFARAARKRPALFAETQLVLAGHKGWHAEKLLAAIEKEKADKFIRYIGYITHNEKVNLLKGAQCLLFPSLYEGFGLPVLEAFALGTPVLTSTVSSLPEIAGDAALLAHPEHEEEIADGIVRLLSDEKLRQRLIARGAEQAKRFSWEKCAEETRRVYEETFARRKKQGARNK